MYAPIIACFLVHMPQRWPKRLHFRMAQMEEIHLKSAITSRTSMLFEISTSSDRWFQTPFLSSMRPCNGICAKCVVSFIMMRKKRRWSKIISKMWNSQKKRVYTIGWCYQEFTLMLPLLMPQLCDEKEMFWQNVKMWSGLRHVTLCVYDIIFLTFSLLLARLRCVKCARSSISIINSKERKEAGFCPVWSCRSLSFCVFHHRY